MNHLNQLVLVDTYVRMKIDFFFFICLRNWWGEDEKLYVEGGVGLLGRMKLKVENLKRQIKVLIGIHHQCVALSKWVFSETNTLTCIHRLIERSLSFLRLFLLLQKTINGSLSLSFSLWRVWSAKQCSVMWLGL